MIDTILMVILVWGMVIGAMYIGRLRERKKWTNGLKKILEHDRDRSESHGKSKQLP